LNPRGLPNRRQKVLRARNENRRNILRTSNVRLKVRNIDEKQVTNDDLRVSINNLIYFGYLMIINIY